MDDLLATLPPRFRAVRYDGAQVPGGRNELSSGANCQRYAYAVLAHFGIELPPWRSSELWADAERTRRVTRFEPLDLLLFSGDGQPYGAHVAIYAGRARRCIWRSRSAAPPFGHSRRLRRARNITCWSVANGRC